MRVKFMIFRDYKKDKSDYISVWYSELEKNLGYCIFDTIEEAREVVNDLELNYRVDKNAFRIVAFTVLE